MANKNIILKPGFLLIEALIAGAMLCCMIFLVAQYQWYASMYAAHTIQRSLMLSDVYDFFENKRYLNSAGEIASKSGSIQWNAIPIATMSKVSVLPVRITIQYRIMQTLKTYTIVSAMDMS